MNSDHFLRKFNFNAWVNNWCSFCQGSIKEINPARIKIVQWAEFKCRSQGSISKLDLQLMFLFSFPYIHTLNVCISAWNVFNAVNCKKESEKCQFRGRVIIPGYIKSDLHNLNYYCMNVCGDLNYGHIQESLNEPMHNATFTFNPHPPTPPEKIW